MASFCFGDVSPSPVQRRLAVAALARAAAREVAPQEASLPPDFLRAALAATAGWPVGHSQIDRSKFVPSGRAAAGTVSASRFAGWASLAAGVAGLCVSGLLVFHSLQEVDAPEMTRLPRAETPAKWLPELSPASRGPHASAAREPATYVRLSPDLKRALRAFLANPAGAEVELLHALVPLAGTARHIRLDERLAALLRENRPLTGIRVENEAGELLLLPPGRAP